MATRPDGGRSAGRARRAVRLPLAVPEEKTAIKRTLIAIGRGARDEWTVSKTRVLDAREKERVGATRRRKALPGGADARAGAGAAPIAI